MSSGLNQEFKQASVLRIMTVKAVWSVACVAERGNGQKDKDYAFDFGNSCVSGVLPEY